MMSSKIALQRLIEGNRRYIAQIPIHPNQTADRRREVAGGQKPFAIVLGCSDSRVPPEVIFDQGLGDLFVVRVAGNIVDGAVMGSIEYAIEHLETPLLVVLGHGKCGAVSAAIKGGEPHGHIGGIVEAIAPAVDKAKSQTGDLLTNAVKANIAMIVSQLMSSEPVLAELVKSGKLEIVGAFYDLESGEIEVL